MADPDPKPVEPSDAFEAEVETNLALEQGLGVGARELASIGESGADGTLEREEDDDA